ncbi:hypothetical protein HNO91_02795 [Pseudomonas corrugata]|uniref:Uncharacterized protein n=1 Tax=Pseudomonas corrugata TaxID=47879 RepID=A0A7Y6DFU0_9PSED|nr:hypothetical protein [Pseudomonas corrugata]MCI0995644.1 hypothetical protein [Pseudomonas corrugata]NUT65106.1 hypothetical protein [Pseudomonas corrugata]NUT85331.1 hypothetical protein [Pseudomonas corrugata]
MKKLFLLLIAAVLATQTLRASAETSPVGSWKFASYHVPGGGFYANQTICFKADNTWYSSSQAGWKGAWFQNGDDLQWNGSVPMNGAGSANNLATIAMGKVVATGSMAGNYAEWAAPSAPPLPWDRHYTYTMTYQGATCGAPK